MRIAFISLSIYGFLILNMYEAMFAAMLAVEVVHPPVNGKDSVEKNLIK